MAVCSANYKCDSESLSCFCESSKETLGCASCNPGGPFVSDLGYHFTESLSIKDGEDLIYKEHSNTLEEDGSEDMHANDADTGSTDSEKCLIKSSEFPGSSISTPPAELVHERKEQEADSKSTDLPYSRSISSPTALKLVSAIKGSREKQGKPPKKLSVTWAPDVYDPIPTAASHVPIKGQRHRSDHRKNGKNKQKSNGKSSRGSKGKDKKQGRKHGGSTRRSYYPLEDKDIMTCNSFHCLEDEITAHSSGLQAGAMDYDIGSPPDSFCGSSFRKKSVTELHFPVAKAS
ncbi:uncharacterized protein LOC107031144 [Solanum pennellii]|uniref:Uncharacterized protein LOC107031144 n=1 Tax=Solanum pennellii TaxID=28526 RepID=A0ABM1UW00_SOLPN|nr:uncharacterized protein LOC107031144 [Solanum pennellii]XP_027767668.1 uncharacterized protein LOC107031144 [Solanum pennellii]